MRKYIEKAMTFAEYVELIDGLLAEGKTTGPIQSDEMFRYAKLNRQRMKRLEKTVELEAEAGDELAHLDADQYWLVITEGWCGDAAQNIPVIEKLASANERIETKYILRDEYPELIEQFLTNGSRSIPVLIAIDKASSRVLGRWGSRPSAAQELFTELRSLGREKNDINEKLQRWYNDDRGRSLQFEIAELARSWTAKRAAAGEGI